MNIKSPVFTVVIQYGVNTIDSIRRFLNSGSDAKPTLLENKLRNSDANSVSKDSRTTVQSGMAKRVNDSNGTRMLSSILILWLENS